MKNTCLVLICFLFLATSCKKDERPTYITDKNGAAQPVQINSSSPKASLMAQAGVGTANNLPAGVQQISAPPGMMNPPHGQPGHRCDIAVGQPLNGVPAQQKAKSADAQNVNINSGQTITIDPKSMKPQQAAVNANAKPVKTAPGMNPPHGQPGHRCDIPVGQPLNSKPTPSPQAVAQNNVQLQNPQPLQTPQPAPTGPKPATNPPHGEPWHDCAKQVGAPL